MTPRSTYVPLSAASDRIAVAAVILVTLASFLPSLFNGFTNFDDDIYLTENPLVAQPSLDNLQRIFGGFYLRHYHPLTLVSYMVERSAWDLWAPGFHITNLVLHLGSTALVFAIARRLGLGTIGAATTSLLFGIHPVHVESVAWISERKDVLSMFFLLLAVLFYLRSQDEHRPGLYVGSLVAYVLSLLSKALGMLVGFLLWILEWGQGRRINRARWLNKLPYLVLGSLAALLTWLAQLPEIHADKTTQLGRGIAIAARSFWFYLGKLAWPAGLSALHPYPAHVDPRAPGYVAAVVGCVLFAAATILVARRFRAWTAAWAFFAVAWLPFSGLVSFSIHWAADRYMYLAALGPFALAGLGVERIAGSRVVRRHAWARFGTIGVFAAAALILGAATAARCRVWKNGETVCRNILEHYPDSTVALTNLGAFLAAEGRHSEALRIYRRSLEIDPTDYVVLSNIGASSQALGRLEEALQANLRAVELRPGSPLPWTNLGTLYLQLGETEKARQAFGTAARLNPDDEAVRATLERLDREP